MRNTEAFEIAKTLKPGHVIEFRCIMRAPASDCIQTAKIKSVGLTESGSIGITYIPCDRPNSVQCGFGCHFIAEDGEKGRTEWGWQWIRIIGEEALCHNGPRFSGASLYKNPGFDLVNI